MTYKEFISSGIKPEKQFTEHIKATVRQADLTIPNKLELFPFCYTNNIKTAKLIYSGNIKEYERNGRLEPYLPESYCLKPINGAGCRGVFLMHKGTNLQTGKKYNNFSEIREDYIMGQSAYHGYSDYYYIEELIYDTLTEQPDNYKIFAFSGNVEFIRMYRPTLRNNRRNERSVSYHKSGEVFYTLAGGLDLPNTTIINRMVDFATKVVNALNNPVFLRVDCLFANNEIYLGELTPTDGIMGTYYQDDNIQNYLGYLFELNKNKNI